MRYKSKEEAQKDHIDNYRSDGVSNKKMTRYSSDYYRGQYIIQNVPDGSYVLDVGCNGGTTGVQLLQKNCYVKGVDIVAELVEKAKKRGVFAEVGEAEDLSRYPGSSFDVVICTEVLEHLFDPLEAIAEAFRVLKPGGKYIVTVPHPNGMMGVQGGDYHQQEFSIEILDTLFHNFFKRGDVTFSEISYIPEYCKANNISHEQPQWIGLEAVKS